MKPIFAILFLMTIASSCSKDESFEQDRNKQTEQMYQQARSKEAEIIRQEKFSDLERSDKEFDKKVAAAIVYFKSFEFQLWNADKNNNSIVRDRLYADAVNEFSKHIDRIYNNINLKKLNPSNRGKKHSYEQAFYAIAVTMHMSPFSKGHYIDSEANNKGLSIYNLIQNALLKDQNGEVLLDYEERLINGINKEIMIELIKARMDMMASMAVDHLTNNKKFTTRQRVRTTLFRVTNGVMGAMDLPEAYEELNTFDKKETIIFLEAAVKAKAFLRDISEYEADVEKSIRSSLENIEFNNSRQQEVVEPGQQVQEESDILRMEISELIKELIR